MYNIYVYTYNTYIYMFLVKSLTYCHQSARHVVLHLHVPRAAAQDHGETDRCAKAEEGDHLLHGRAVIPSGNLT